MNPPCARGITEITLLSWRDDALPPASATALRDHVPTCPACTAYLALLATCGRDLRHQRLPAAMRSPQRHDEMWHAVQAQISRRPGQRQRIAYSELPAMTRGARAVSVALLLIALLFGITQLMNGEWGPSSRSATTRAIRKADLSSATTITIPAYFVPAYVSSDGATIIGARYTRQRDAGYHATAIARYTIAAGTLDALYTLPASAEVMYGNVASDGRYVVWATGPAAMRLMALDLQTMQTQIIDAKPDASQRYGDYIATVDHGNVFWQDMAVTGSGGALKMTDLAYGTTTTLTTALAIPSGNVMSTPLFQESWPLVLFRTPTSDIPTDAPEEFLNVITGDTQFLPKPPVTAAQPASGAVHYALSGTDVLAAWVAHDGSETFAQLPNIDQPVTYDGIWQTLTTIAQPFVFTTSAFQTSDSLLVFAGTPANNRHEAVALAWDRYRHQLIQLAPPQAADAAGLYLTDGQIILATYLPVQSSTTLTLFYTSQLFP